ncbi:MAG: hypothetical protein KY439_02335 [Actinobacteria bacterium]|nr:hypothetical protein [Actinomycetota bacterium]
MNPHLDDEQLSADLDGFALDERGRSHLDGCAACAARRRDLAMASMAVATPVAALAPALVDALIANAAAEAPVAGATRQAGVVDLQQQREARARSAGNRARSGRRAGPPRPWLAGAAAALAVLAGLAGLTRATSERGDQATAFRGAEDKAGAGAGATSAARVVDPSVVTGDLGGQEDPAVLVATLSASAGAGPLLAGAPPGDAGGNTNSGAKAAPVPEAQVARGGGEAGAVIPDRALCVAVAREIGAGRLGGHLSTSTLRWKHEPAEVLVFELTEPAGGITRQALVLRRPGCDLLADPRF